MPRSPIGWEQRAAAASGPATVEDGPLSDWQKVFDINVLGYVRVIRAALP